MISLNVKDSQHSTSQPPSTEWKIIHLLYKHAVWAFVLSNFSIRSDVWSPASVSPARNPLKWSWNYNEVNYTFFQLFLVQINRRNFSTRVDVPGHLVWHQKTAQDKEKRGFVCAVVKLKQTFRRMIINFSSLVVLFGICFYTKQGLTGMFTLGKRFIDSIQILARLELCFHGNFLITKTLWKSKSVCMRNEVTRSFVFKKGKRMQMGGKGIEILKKWLKMKF